MASDAHAHPWDLAKKYPEAEIERQKYGIACAASSWRLEEFDYLYSLAKDAENNNYAPVILGFGVHPQLALLEPDSISEGHTTLCRLAHEGKISFIGECGFDLYDASYRNTLAVQEKVFLAQLELALRYKLPLVLHIRKAMHKVFEHASLLAALPAVLFHSFPGSIQEAQSIQSKGIHAYYSFSTAQCLYHKRTRAVIAKLDASSILFETDAPWQAPFPAERPYSQYTDVKNAIQATAECRRDAKSDYATFPELEALSDSTFRSLFGYA